MSFICKIVIFDLDGVVLESREATSGSYHEAFLNHGIYVDIDEIRKNIYEGRSGNDFIPKLIIKYSERFKKVNETNEIKNQIYDNKNELLLTKFLNEIAVYEDSISILENLYDWKTCGFLKTAVVSNQTKGREIIEKKELEKFFDVIVDGNDVEYHKPHPQPYEKAIKDLKINSNKSEIIIIEDSPIGICSAFFTGIGDIGYLLLINRKGINKREISLLTDCGFSISEIENMKKLFDYLKLKI